MTQGQRSGRDLAIGAGLVAGALGLLALTVTWIEGTSFAHGQELIPPRPLPAVQLVGSDGRALDPGRWKGRWLLLYFGYTYCPDVCPAALRNLAEVMGRLGPLGQKLQVLFISIDSPRDTPAAAQLFARHFHPAFLGTATSVAGATPLIRKAGTPFPFGSDGTAAPDPTRHPAQFFIVDPQGRMVAKYADDVPADDLADDLTVCIGR